METLDRYQRAFKLVRRRQLLPFWIGLLWTTISYRQLRVPHHGAFAWSASLRMESPFSQKSRDSSLALSYARDTTNPNIPEIHFLKHIRRVYCLSDLHVDHPTNMAWLRNKTSKAASNLWNQNDLFVVAGDISHKMETIEESLSLLRSTGAEVVFVPGNHEAWIAKDERSTIHSSLQKLQDIQDLCQRLGVMTTKSCVCVQHNGAKDLWIVPLESWYDGSLSIVDSNHHDLISDFQKWPWMDFRQCVWPDDFYASENGLLEKIPTGLVGYFLKQNQQAIDRFRKTIDCDDPKPIDVLTLSHFLPNRECLPDWKEPETKTFSFASWLDHGAGGMSAKFALVAGSTEIDAQIRSLTSHTYVEERLHIFGHSHRPKDFEYRGIRYIHNPLGKPRERELHMVDPNVDFKLVWDAGKVPKAPRVIRFWEEQGGGLFMLQKRMAEANYGRSKRRTPPRERPMGRYSDSYASTDLKNETKSH